MTLPQVEEQWGYWKAHPPVHELVAAYLGYEPPMSHDEMVKAGAMNIVEFAHYAKKTGGKVDTGPPPAG